MAKNLKESKRIDKNRQRSLKHLRFDRNIFEIVKKEMYDFRDPITDIDNNDGNQGISTPSDDPQAPQGCIAGRSVNYCPSRARNGVCDPECNNQRCGFDGGDCRPPPPPPVTTTRRPRPTRPPPTTTQRPSCNRRYPADYCPQRAGNGRCDPVSVNKFKFTANFHSLVMSINLNFPPILNL